MSCYFYDCGDDYCRFPKRYFGEIETIVTIEGICVEDFLKRFPEFKALLSDPELSEDFIYSTLKESQLDIQFGRWPSEIALESVYLLTAHILQTRFDQQSVTASMAVAASQGKNAKPTGNTNPTPTVNLDLSNTTYGVRLLRLQAQSRANGGVVL